MVPGRSRRRPSIADTYLFDHVDERALFSELTQLAREASTGKPDALARLQRQSIALTEHLHAHVRKENELIFPLVNELFSPPEQGEMVGKMIADLTPEYNVIAMPWIVRMNDADGAAVYVDGQAAGQVTSGSFAPSLERNVGFAFVPPGAAEPGTEIGIDIRGRPAPARVVETPFFRRPRAGSSPDRARPE